MPDIFGPFDGQPWAQAEWYRDAPFRAPSGVYGSPAAGVGAGDLPLTVNGLAVSVGLGRAHVRGAGYERTGTPWSGTVPANTNTTLSRVDRVVLRRDLAAKTVLPVRLQGTPAASPAPPALSRVENGTWDLPLFRFRVQPNSSTTLADVTDERAWIDPDGGGTLVPVAVNFGWTAAPTNPPHVYLTGFGTAKLIGHHTNSGGFTANGTQFPVTVPVGFRPAVSQVFAVPYSSPGNGAGFMLATLLTDGRLRYDIQTVGSPAPNAGAGFFLDGIEWHLSYPNP